MPTRERTSSATASGGSAHLEWALLEALAVTGADRGPDSGIRCIRSTTGCQDRPLIFPAVKEDDSGRPDRSGFAHKQIHEGDPMCW